MSEQLKPCPFCGGAAYFFKIVDEESSDFGGEGIVCTSCNASTGLRFACGDEVKPKLAETWNRRPDTRAMGASADLPAVNHTLAGFRGGFIGVHGRAPTEQEIWNGAVRSGMDRAAIAASQAEKSTEGK